MERKDWKREECVTRGADPTVMVTWRNGEIEIQEFQNVYGTAFSESVTGSLASEVHFDGPIAMLGRELHKALERGYVAQNEIAELNYVIEEDRMEKDGEPE